MTMDGAGGYVHLPCVCVRVCGCIGAWVSVWVKLFVGEFVCLCESL